ncbi:MULTISPECIES: hypothetical protein [unclassified Streptomyces]|uniref:hypothetical protein n=1 Tax=unclassified Streptomyces TaxID=2593676 RepID=UPI0010132786|nr:MULTISPECIES: hypothetical protein [unclassified Streptomyces]NJA59639.1 hypothetical protein [Streptomyces sp. NEAU-H3]
MKTRGIKLTAMAAITVLALTGFSTGRGHGTGSRHGSGGHGGGCSSSSQRQNGSSSSDDDDAYDSGYNRGYNSGTNRRHTSTPGPAASGTGSGSTRASTITATLVSCVSAGKPWSTVRLKNTGTRTGRYTGSVTFYDKDGGYVDLQGIVDVSVAKGKTKTVKVKPLDPTGIKRCVLTDEEDF